MFTLCKILQTNFTEQQYIQLQDFRFIMLRENFGISS